MIWFDGPIKNAVDIVKSSGTFLLVFVQGDSSLSKEYEIYLNHKAEFSPDDFVAIKIPHKSVAFQQFKQIYVSVPVPSVFLIQNNGIPLNVISSEKISDIQSAITDALSKVKVKQDKKVKVQSTGESIQSTEKTASNPTERVKNKGRKLIDISEEELKKRLREIRAFPKFLLIDSSTTDPPKPPSTPPKYLSARIQFCLPDNTRQSWEFPDLSTLKDVRAYLIETLKLSSNFKFLRTYPRATFSSEDEEKTLLELSLIPSATLIIVPVEDKTVQARLTDYLVRRSFFSTVLNTLLQPVFIILNFFKKNFFGTPIKEEKTTKRLPSDTEFEKSINKKTSTSNIHGFKFRYDKESDSENPDNGNSTQQQYKK